MYEPCASKESVKGNFLGKESSDLEEDTTEAATRDDL